MGVTGLNPGLVFSFCGLGFQDLSSLTGVEPGPLQGALDHQGISLNPGSYLYSFGVGAGDKGPSGHLQKPLLLTEV